MLCSNRRVKRRNSVVIMIIIMIMIMIMITKNIVTNWYVQEWKEKIYKSHRRISYNLPKNNCKDWDSIVSVGKLFQSRIDLGHSYVITEFIMIIILLVAPAS